jgi:hypothetical protein
MRVVERVFTAIIVARMERSVIRGGLSIETLIPDCAALHPGYECVQKSGAVPP